MPRKQQEAAGRRWARTLALALWVSGVAGCAVVSEGPSVEHVVICWVKDPADAGAIREIVDTSHSFRQLPGVRRVRAGRILPSDRPEVDTSFQVGVVMTFDDPASLRAYLEHPKHRRAVAEVLRPHVDRIQVYDFIVADDSRRPGE